MERRRWLLAASVITVNGVGESKLLMISEAPDGGAKPATVESREPLLDEVRRDVGTIAAYAAVNAIHGCLADAFPGI